MLETSTTRKAEAAPKPVTLAPAAESGDPAVHQLLAELQTARLNGDTEKTDAAVKALADLGYQ